VDIGSSINIKTFGGGTGLKSNALGRGTVLKSNASDGGTAKAVPPGLKPRLAGLQPHPFLRRWAAMSAFGRRSSTPATLP